ncbi:MAG: MBL fold metallo-hydrolase [Clostridiales bacterium]|nr:MBL fold metallo-hydrolase [Clostridiales bacterium]
MEICSIASGSSGNCIYVGNDNTHILVDTGISKKRVVEGLHQIGIKPEEIDAVLITHEHSDHIQGLGVFCRKYGTKVYATKGTAFAIENCKSLGKLPEGLIETVSYGEDFLVGDINVHPIQISHDAAEPTAYRFENGDQKTAVMTDLGYFDDRIVKELQNLDGILLEANHDVCMLQVGPYPYPLKQRILGNRGHLSNENSGRLLDRILHDNMKQIILGHLSKENNLPELAFETVKLEITLGNSEYKGTDFPISVARRDTCSPLVTL